MAAQIPLQLGTILSRANLLKAINDLSEVVLGLSVEWSIDSSGVASKVGSCGTLNLVDSKVLLKQVQRVYIPVVNSRISVVGVLLHEIERVLAPTNKELNEITLALTVRELLEACSEIYYIYRAKTCLSAMHVVAKFAARDLFYAAETKRGLDTYASTQELRGVNNKSVTDPRATPVNLVTGVPLVSVGEDGKLKTGLPGFKTNVAKLMRFHKGFPVYDILCMTTHPNLVPYEVAAHKGSPSNKIVEFSAPGGLLEADLVLSFVMTALKELKPVAVGGFLPQHVSSHSG